MTRKTNPMNDIVSWTSVARLGGSGAPHFKKERKKRALGNSGNGAGAAEPFGNNAVAPFTCRPIFRQVRGGYEITRMGT